MIQDNEQPFKNFTLGMFRQWFGETSQKTYTSDEVWGMLNQACPLIPPLQDNQKCKHTVRFEGKICNDCGKKFTTPEVNIEKSICCGAKKANAVNPPEDSGLKAGDQICLKCLKPFTPLQEESKTDWEEDLFGLLYDNYGDMGRNQEIKSFIHSLLTQHSQSLREKISNIETYYGNPKEKKMVYIDDILKLIND